VSSQQNEPDIKRDAGFLRLFGVSLQYVLPHHFISRLIFIMTRWQMPMVPWVIRQFVKVFKVNMEEAVESDPRAYRSFNAFFTRALKPELRPIPECVPGETMLISPVDGRISQLGDIQNDRIFQAKGQWYSAVELLGGDLERAQPFSGGKFMTIYLSPRDYHRIHMPCDGRLREMVHVPGRLFSVSPLTVTTVPRVFARNERVVTIFETEKGLLAMVLVGAINVAAIETLWSGLITPPRGREISCRKYGAATGIEVNLKQGQEMGRFNMGSTVILLTQPGVEWDSKWNAEDPVKLFEKLGVCNAVAASEQDDQPDVLVSR